jgi:hypothetical protein
MAKALGLTGRWLPMVADDPAVSERRALPYAGRIARSKRSTLPPATCKNVSQSSRGHETSLRTIRFAARSRLRRADGAPKAITIIPCCGRDEGLA